MRRLILVTLLLAAGCGVQPTDPIVGTPATGAVIYLVQGDTVVPVLRPTRNPTSGDEALALLTDGPTPTERGHVLKSEIPSGAAPITLTGSTVTVSVPASELSDLALVQIVCTAAVHSPVTVVGGGHERGPLDCPA
ncbi:hypothetical protein [Actinokineospora enzanensis]|uniref:hypothetical protein n=1 Tax=Actinokineospora enzanensis TaxID=155975 RepID=UPI00037718E9|nr:hypothetical protein [Actinokineospora enzanensis]